MVSYANNGKSKWLGYIGKIEGNNVNLYECEVCGQTLKQREYLERTDLCYSCKRKAYGRGQHTYKLRGGNNDIDKILINKMEVKN